jgi:hypothetical protein
MPHGGFVMVQRKVYAVPAVPVNVLTGLVGVVIDPPVPLTILHAPVPVTGVLPANVTVVIPQVEIPVWSGPAIAVVGFWLNVTTISSAVDPHGTLVIVQRNVYVVPAVPVKVLVGLVGEAIVPPVPDTILHKPDPTTGVLAASVTVVIPHVKASD